MTAKQIASAAARAAQTGLISTMIFQLAIGSTFAAGQTVESTADPSRDFATTTPIKHVIVIIGENRSFDHVFATYVPQNGQTVFNLLSQGIVKADGTPGPNFPAAEQKAATDKAPDDFLLSPTTNSYSVLPAPLNGGPVTSYVKDDDLDVATQSENGLPADYYAYLVTGGSGLKGKIPDTRISNVSALPPGPFQLTNQATFTYNSYAASPVHRFYQMWQQLDCSLAHATATNPSGCDAALFPWVETTVGAGTNGLKQPANFSTDYSPNGEWWNRR
jgi:phospholipase C